MQQLLTHLLRALERRDPQQLFAWPVTDRIAPNYSRLISKPMDFETIRRNIQSNQYTSLNAFVVSIYINKIKVLIYASKIICPICFILLLKWTIYDNIFTMFLFNRQILN